MLPHRVGGADVIFGEAGDSNLLMLANSHGVGPPSIL